MKDSRLHHNSKAATFFYLRLKLFMSGLIQFVLISPICQSWIKLFDQCISGAACAAVVLDLDTPLSVWSKRGWCLQEGVAAGILRGISLEGTLATIQTLAND